MAEPQTIKLEVGKKYRTRGGEDVAISRTIPLQDGTTFYGGRLPGRTADFAWSEDGSTPYVNGPMPFDLVEEVETQPLRLALHKSYRTRDGKAVRRIEHLGDKYAADADGRLWYIDGGASASMLQGDGGDLVEEATKLSINIQEIAETVARVLAEAFDPSKSSQTPDDLFHVFRFTNSPEVGAYDHIISSADVNSTRVDHVFTNVPLERTPDGGVRLTQEFCDYATRVIRGQARGRHEDPYDSPFTGVRLKTSSPEDVEHSRRNGLAETSSMPDENVRPGTPGFHEVVHAASMVHDQFVRHVREHRGVLLSPALYRQADEVSNALWSLYHALSKAEDDGLVFEDVYFRSPG